MAEIQPSRVFELGGGHLGKWRRDVADAFFGLGMSISACVLIFIKIGSKMAKIQPSRFFQHGGGGGGHLGK